ncbi:alpha/beta fold hydrolase [Pseudonocardiaceae bacterium YIM PH 21723]|nr:alpha/beta fold hydrolase [Pseudonocardiaceae bacterium YIM PH 21723]
MATTTLDGITFGFEDTRDGTGLPVVLVHGTPFDRTMWRPQLELLRARDRRVITPDLRGYGESDVVSDITYLSDFAQDIARLLDHLDVDRIVLGGLSMGGQIVMDFYRQFPDRVRGLLLADTFAAAETPEGRKHRNAVADRLLREGSGPLAQELLPKMVSPANIAAQPDVARHVLDMMIGANPAGQAAAQRGRAERPDYIPLLSEISVPTLVVVGRDDEFTPVSDAELLHERIPDATLVVIEDAAHMPNLEQTPAFDAALTAFLDSLVD